MYCSECDGVGYVERCRMGHTGCCPCSADDLECENCEGCGRLCNLCAGPIPVSRPRNQVVCGDCVQEGRLSFEQVYEVANRASR